MPASENTAVDVLAIPNSQPTTATTTEASLNIPATAANTHARRTAARDTNERYVPPRLNASKSFTVGAGPRMLDDETASQARRKMNQTFSGHEDRPGDTQPMESQLFKAYATSHLEGITGFGEDLTAILGEGGLGEGQNGGLLNEDEAMGFSLAKDWEDGADDAEGSTLDFEAEIADLSPATQSRVQHSLSQRHSLSQSPMMSSPRFAVPKTPAIAGNKRSYDGEIMTSATKTPGSAFANAFGNSKVGVSLTQMFNETQAQTPNGNELKSDPIFQRPSPNFAEHRSSPPQFSTSSPVKQAQSDPPRATTEPREAYRTMKESQELRERRRQQEAGLGPSKSDTDNLDDDFERDQQEAERRRRRAEFNRQAQKDLANLRAPDRSGASHRKARSLISSNANYDTPIRSAKRNTRPVIEISDAEEEESDISTDELAEDMPTGSARSRSGTSKEDGVQVPRTSSRPYNSSAKRKRSSPPTSPIEGNHHLQPSPKRLQQRALSQSQKALSGTQTVVVDSQPLARDRSLQNSLPRTQQIVGPSSPDSVKRIEQSPTSPVSSQTRRAVQAAKSSSLPRAPPLSSQIRHSSPGDQMRSSPPLGLVPEEDNGEVEAEGPADDDATDLVDGNEELETTNATPVNDAHDALRSDATVNQSSPVRPRRIAGKPPEISRPHTNLNDDTETDSVDASAGNQPSPSKVGSTTDSHTPGQYQTAHSHLTGSHEKNPDTETRSGETTPTNTPLRSLKDIAAERSPGREDTQDQDIQMSFNMDTPDDDHFELFRSPQATKKKKTYGKRPNVYRSPNKLEVISTSNHWSPTSVKSNPTPAIDVLQNVEQSIPKDLPAPLNSDIDGPSFSTHAILKKGSTLSRAASKLPPMKHPVVRSMGSSGRTGETPRRKPIRIAETPQWKSAGLSSDIDTPVQNTTVETSRRDTSPVKKTTRPPDLTVTPITYETSPAKPSDDHEVLNPTRVFARFKGGPGGNMSYWPATCIGFDGKLFKIRFDDETVDFMEGLHVRSLDLREEDLVKVDRPKMRQKSYIVRGLKDKIGQAMDADKGEFAITDRAGFQVVRLEVKQRESMPPSQRKVETVDVPIESIYITGTMWPRFTNRSYEHSSTTEVSKSRRGTPAGLPLSPSTPQSRSRRPPKTYLEPFTSDLNLGTSSPVPRVGGLFSNMAFGLTLGRDSEENRNTLSTAIRSQGGTLLEPGFESLFDIQDSDPDTTNTASDSLTLKPKSASLGFVAVLADAHSSRTKHIQALALGIPCLSTRWIHDSVAKATPVSFAPYLLPAGDSLFLGGAVRSRVLPEPACYLPGDKASRLRDVLGRRERMLRGQRVLLVLGKGSTVARMENYYFLCYALGATCVLRVKSLADSRVYTTPSGAGAEAEEFPWDYVLVDSDATDTAAKELFDTVSDAGSGVSGRSTAWRAGKRQKGAVPMLKRGRVAGREVRVVSDEFVKQSLILGALLDD